MAQHNITGKNGEDIACAFLIKNGYAILERNWRSGKNEVDIIAKIGTLLVFIEVKTRTSSFFGYPEKFVSPTQQKSLAKIADYYCYVKKLSDVEIRYDIISIISNKKQEEVHHIIDAFLPKF